MNTQLDTWSLARMQRTLNGEAALSAFSRLLSGQPEQAPSKVSWEVSGETDALGRRYLTLHAHAVVTLECQRCLGLFDLELKADSRLELVETEAELEAEDAEEEDPETPDRVLGSTHFDLQSLVEDELILVLPYVPKHKVCPSLPKALERAEGSDTRRPSPFSVLAELKKD